MESEKGWEDVAKYIAAGNLAEVQFSNDFTSAILNFIYGDGKEEIRVNVTCSEYAYLDLRRSENHTTDCGLIFEAYLHENSDLITSLKEHKLETKSGCLYLERSLSETKIYHLEIIGELSLNILCNQIRFCLHKA